MAMMHAKPKFCKYCVFCNNWTGDAHMEFVSTGMGYKFDGSASGKCIKKNGAVTHAGSGCSQHYEPNPEAKKLL